MNQREVIIECKRCGQPAEYKIGRGKSRLYCDDVQCKRERHAERERNARRVGRSKAVCTEPYCSNPASRKDGAFCEACYYRKRRGNTGAPKEPKYRYETKRGYIMVKCDGHPLVGKTGYTYEHRIVAYEANNGVPPLCYWCDAVVTWKKCHIDHLDSDKTNNTVANLVVSCSICNQLRGLLGSFTMKIKPQRRKQLLKLAGLDGVG